MDQSKKWKRLVGGRLECCICGKAIEKGQVFRTNEHFRHEHKECVKERKEK